jgi:hypothetical protein
MAALPDPGFERAPGLTLSYSDPRVPRVPRGTPPDDA